jgi:hypothetical protein
MLFKDDSLDKVEEVRSEWVRLTGKSTSSCLEITKLKPWEQEKELSNEDFSSILALFALITI